MGYNRSGVKFAARLKRRRREAMRLASKTEAASPAPAPTKPVAAPKKSAKS